MLTATAVNPEPTIGKGRTLVCKLPSVAGCPPLLSDTPGQSADCHNSCRVRTRGSSRLRERRYVAARGEHSGGRRAGHRCLRSSRRHRHRRFLPAGVAAASGLFFRAGGGKRIRTQPSSGALRRWSSVRVAASARGRLELHRACPRNRAQPRSMPRP